jgi:divalent metal cation (Fe/Co/Zn/Cd) transporter
VDTDASVADEVHDPTIRAAATAAVVEITGREPVDMRLRTTAKGLVAYVTVLAAADQTLREAHALATRVEERICQRCDEIADVVVHTEPVQPAGD